MLDRFAMALYCYYQPVHGDNLPDPKGPLSTTTEANTQVQEVVNMNALKKRGSYDSFHVKKRAAVGKYACVNRVVDAARYYPRIIKHPVNKTASSHCSVLQ